MQANVGSLDRALRIIAGLAILSLIVILEGPSRWFGLVGLVPLATGIMRWCPAYSIFGIKTCRSA
jgi:hypothetical protein